MPCCDVCVVYGAGAFYYYNTEPGKNYADTLVDVVAEGKRQKLPYQYLQLDRYVVLDIKTVMALLIQLCQLVVLQRTSRRRDGVGIDAERVP